MKVAVLGAGRVGRATASDLAKETEFEVTIADLGPEALEALEEIPNVTTAQADVSDQASVRHITKELNARGVTFNHTVEEVTG